MPFDPPAVENAEAGHAIQGGLHAAGSGSLQRKLRRIEPQVHSRSNLPAEVHVVVVEENYGHGFPQRFLRVIDPPDNIFPASIVGVSFARIDDLEVAGVLGNLPETIEVSQDQV